ncbi:MAG: RluA family pseudouridine synthase [Candidatus Gracilibacteria bacterium]|jgi:23S rRNA pseudouridine1911/1915/1917 synthase
MKKTIKSTSTGRLDKILTESLEGLTRQKIQLLIKDGLVKVNHQKATKPNKPIKEGDFINVEIIKKPLEWAKPQKMNLDIIYENKDYLIINKPAGIVVHPAPGHKENTLVNGLLYHLKKSISKKEDTIRPGIVHRLDQDTSGILVIAKNDSSHYDLSRQIEKRTVKKTYIGLVYGLIDHKGRIEAPIMRNPLKREEMTVDSRGKESITEFQPIKIFKDKNCTLIEVDLKTGRTHQIRVHMASIGHPIIGDTKYGTKKINEEFKKYGINRQFLHAEKLTFKNLQKKQVSYTTKLPKDLQSAISKL